MKEIYAQIDAEWDLKMVDLALKEGITMPLMETPQGDFLRVENGSFHTSNYKNIVDGLKKDAQSSDLNIRYYAQGLLKRLC